VFIMVLLVRLPAQLDESNAAEVGAGLMEAVERHPLVLIADMSGTRSCDWAGARALAGTFSQAARCGTELRLVAPSESVRRVIRLNGLDRLMPVFDDWAAASSSLPVG
jgi:anti-anti-sigma factor